MNYKNIKLLIISTTKFDLDGITNVILNYYRSIDKSDMQIDFVIPNDIRMDFKKEIESYGSRIYIVEGRMRNPLLYVSKLIKIINENNYNIVHAHGNSCTLALEMYAAKKGGVRVRIPHSHSSKNKYKLAHNILRKPFDTLYTHAFACSQKAGQWLYNGEAFEIINNGIEVIKYKYNAEIREKYRNKYNLIGKKVIGHIGHFTYPKNHEYLISIFAELININNDYRLILIGDGELKPSIEKKVSELGLTNKVIFTGKTLDVPQLMQAMDMIVMPSRFEGLPLTLVEAQSSCLPCFVSDAVSKEVAITDLVQFISLEKSPKEWAEQIDSLEHVNREEIKESIYKQIVNAGYSITDNAKRMKELYKKFIE
ncbi:hypothetical protein Q428_12005 [Fervidicella metallireducens AeB]|uniref:Glycosyl transferase family 1 n=1 Tax=Fervidicella metallireducens AeB TaxID=1403537 RepID=A0A017RSE0_9CLOT|nr:glycosyltransferase family 1 protein [Fervidicella metallireducens]EYE87678.1 hypothetical protein Q428_12005 [Fervidicella metallireducens AeB]